jgi:hypothetical protein
MSTEQLVEGGLVLGDVRPRLRDLVVEFLGRYLGENLPGLDVIADVDESRGPKGGLDQRQDHVARGNHADDRPASSTIRTKSPGA